MRRYTFNGETASPRLITGRELAHGKRTLAQRAFLGADFVTGHALLVNQTQVGAAYNVGVSPAAIHAALHQGADRAAIEAGRQSLFPAPQRALPAPSLQEQLQDLVNKHGSDAVFDTLIDPVNLLSPINAVGSTINGAAVGSTDLN
jgi:hypothetical protein